MSVDDDPDERYRSEFDSLEFQRDIEAAAEQLERNTRSLADVFVEFMERGDWVEVVVGQQRWSGSVVRVGTELLTMETDRETVDIAFDHISLTRVVSAKASAGTAYEPAQSVTLVARLRELSGVRAGAVAKLGGTDLALVVGTVVAVSSSHVELNLSHNESWVVPLRAIGFVVTERW